MKRRIMLDMDGVLCDFDYQVEFYKARKENGKCDWKLMDKIGPQFWSSMPWLEEGRKLYNALLELKKKYQDVEIGIASAIFLRCGKAGKRYWLEKNCPEIDPKNVIITQKGIDKWLELAEGDILVDDKRENIDLAKGVPDGRGVLFKDADTALFLIQQILEQDREIDELCIAHDKALEVGEIYRDRDPSEIHI